MLTVQTVNNPSTQIPAVFPGGPFWVNRSLTELSETMEAGVGNQGSGGRDRGPRSEDGRRNTED